MTQSHGFHLYTCNNLEGLAKAYLTNRRDKQTQFRRDSGVFTRENIAVATRGMAIWLEHWLVEQGHVVANLEFPFMRNAIDEVLARFMKNEKAYRPELFMEEVLIWRLFDILMDETRLASLGELRNYLATHADGSDNRETRCYQLAQKLAKLFFNYMVFLPEVLHPEELPADKQSLYGARKGAGSWQLELWKLLCGNGTVISPAAAILRFLQAKPNELESCGFEPLTFFGVSAMPAYFLRLLKKLGAVTTVNLFYLNYCDEYWADVKSDRAKSRAVDHDQLEEHFNNTLLGNYGLQGRQFFRAVLDLEEDGVEEEWDTEKYNLPVTDAPQAKLLTALQESVRSNVNPDNPPPLAADDDSLTFHSCFNTIRQVEVLHDCLLKLLAERNEDGHHHLRLDDIIVMAPDISQFEPAIRAVFGNGPLASHYAISDRTARNANLLAEAFLTILAVNDGDFEVSRFLKLLDSNALCNRYGFDEEAVQTIREWLQEAGVRWGRDKESRQEKHFGHDEEEYTWRYGLDRMLMRLAMDSDEAQAENTTQRFGDLLPVSYSASGENLRILGGLCSLFRELCSFADNLKTQGGQSVSAWRDMLMNARGQFFRADKDCALDYSLLGKALDGLRDAAAAAGFAQPVSFEVIRTALQTRLEQPAAGEPFLDGRITFCSLLPMRGIPRKVIAMLGMDTGTFPRPEERLGYTLMNRPDDCSAEAVDYNLLEYYDRSRSVEDRFTFLEAMMSAEEHLLVFYRGKDDHTLKDLLPAAPVAELRDYSKRLRTWDKELVVEHSLNAFDAKSFRTAGNSTAVTLRDCFSYSEKQSSLANSLRQADNMARQQQKVKLVKEMAKMAENAAANAAQEAANAALEAEETQTTEAAQKAEEAARKAEEAARKAEEISAGGEQVLQEEELRGAQLLKGVQNLRDDGPLPFRGAVLESVKDGISTYKVTLSVSDLERYFKKAAETFLCSRAGFPREEWESPELTDYEPYDFNALQESVLKRRIGARQLSQETVPFLGGAGREMMGPQYREMRENCELPLGKLGELAFVKMQLETWLQDEDFRKAWWSQEQGNGQAADLQAVDLGEVPPELPPLVANVVGQPDLSKVRFKVLLQGDFNYFPGTDETPAGVYACPFVSHISSSRGKHQLSWYLRHLFLCATEKYADLDVQSLYRDNVQGNPKTLDKHLALEVPDEELDESEIEPDDCEEVIQAQQALEQFSEAHREKIEELQQAPRRIDELNQVIMLLTRESNRAAQGVVPLQKLRKDRNTAQAMLDRVNTGKARVQMTPAEAEENLRAAEDALAKAEKRLAEAQAEKDRLDNLPNEDWHKEYMQLTQKKNMVYQAAVERQTEVQERRRVAKEQRQAAADRVAPMAILRRLAGVYILGHYRPLPLFPAMLVKNTNNQVVVLNDEAERLLYGAWSHLGMPVAWCQATHELLMFCFAELMSKTGNMPEQVTAERAEQQEGGN